MKASSNTSPSVTPRARTRATLPSCGSPADILAAVEQVVRAYMKEQIDAERARTAGYLLQVAAGVWRTCEIERRVAEIEQRLAAVEAGSP